MFDNIIKTFIQFFQADGVSQEEFNKEAEAVYQLGKQLGFEPEIKSMIQQKKKEVNAGYVTGSGQSILPLRNEEEIKTAAAWLVKYKTHLSFSARNKIAENILEKAAQFNVRLPRDIESDLRVISGEQIGNLEIIRDQLDKREKLLKSLKFDKKAAMISNLKNEIDEDTSIDTLKFIALAIDRLDRDHVFINKYGRSLLPPEDFLFKRYPPKTEQIKVARNKRTGAVYNQEDFMQIKMALLESLGEDFVQDVTIGEMVDSDKIAIWLEDAPKEKAELFDQIAKLSNVHPIGYCQPE